MPIASDGQSLGLELSPGIFEPGGQISPQTRRQIFRRVFDAGENGVEFGTLRVRCAYDLPTNEEFAIHLSDAIAAGYVTLLRTPWEPSVTHAYGWMHVNRATTDLLRVMDIDAAHLPLSALGIEPIERPKKAAPLAASDPAPNGWRSSPHERVLKIIEDAGLKGATTSEIIRKTYNIENRNGVIDDLLQSGLITQTRVNTATKPKTVYRAVQT
jgi:hypothetical protein